MNIPIEILIDDCKFITTIECINSHKNFLLSKIINHEVKDQNVVMTGNKLYINRDPESFKIIMDFIRGYYIDINSYDVKLISKFQNDLEYFNLVDYFSETNKKNNLIKINSFWKDNKESSINKESLNNKINQEIDTMDMESVPNNNSTQQGGMTFEEFMEPYEDNFSETNTLDIENIQIIDINPINNNIINDDDKINSNIINEIKLSDENSINMINKISNDENIKKMIINLNNHYYNNTKSDVDSDVDSDIELTDTYVRDITGVTDVINDNIETKYVKLNESDILDKHSEDLTIVSSNISTDISKIVDSNGNTKKVIKKLFRIE